MNIRTFGIIFLLSFSVIFGTQDVFADTLFFDDFSTDPASNGWIEDFIAEFMDGINPFVPPHAGHGSEVILEKNGPSTPAPVREFSITRTISTVGFENIQLSLTAHQTSGAAYEPADFLELSVDTNNDGAFESVLKDVEIWDGINDPDQNQDDSNEAANDSPTSTGFLSLSNAADNNPTFKVKILASFNSQEEDYFLTDFEVIGDVIQNNDVIGGKIIPIEYASLLLASTQSFSWIFLAIIPGIVFGLFVFFKKSKNL